MFYTLCYWYGEEERSVSCKPQHANFAYSIVCYTLRYWCGKESVWFIHQCSVNILYFHGRCTPRLLVELRPVLSEVGSDPQPSLCSLWFVLSPAGLAYYLLIFFTIY